VLKQPFGMTDNQEIEFTEAELSMIYRLCDGASVQGFDAVSVLSSIMTKIRAIAEEKALPEGQSTLPIQSLQD
jgi:hypothetical protein